MRSRDCFFLQGIWCKADEASARPVQAWVSGHIVITTPRLEMEGGKPEAPRAGTPCGHSQHLLGMERRFTQGDRDGPRALGTSQAPLNECSESQSAWRNSPWPWTPAPWHPLTYIFTQLLFLRTETKKKKKKKMQSPTAQQSWMEGLEGSTGFPPRREAGWGGRGSHRRESVRLSPPSWPHPPRHSWFSQTQEGQGGFPVFSHQRKREACRD